MIWFQTQSFGLRHISQLIFYPTSANIGTKCLRPVLNRITFLTDNFIHNYSISFMLVWRFASLPKPHRWRCFAKRTVFDSATKMSYGWRKWLFNKSGSRGVPNANLFHFTFFYWSILVKCCVHLRTSTGKTQMLLLEKTIFHSHWLFCYRFIAFTVDPCSLLSVIRKQ